MYEESQQGRSHSFLEALSVMSKSSPYAVSTERQEALSLSLDEVKKHLYIETEIEVKFESTLKGLSNQGEKKLIFLCGSSGDGKSEILTKYKLAYANRADFHLDATHSFRPTDTAIQTLDELFLDFEESEKSLVVGINVGMMGNYAEEGRVTSVQTSIKNYLERKATPGNHIYLNFEDFPRFTFKDEGHCSQFVSDLLTKITAQENNLIRQYFDKELQSTKPNQRLISNYQILSRPEVQSVIIDVLFKARLIKDQFLTARSLLDFVFHLLAGPGLLQDNLFASKENELTSKIIEFDPANIRSKELDAFVLARNLKLEDAEFDIFRTDLKELGVHGDINASSYVRLFYLLRHADVSNNYHHQFASNFDEQLLSLYSKLWQAHTDYSAEGTERSMLRKFYRDTAVAAIHKYINRNAPELSKGEYFVSSHNGIQLAASLNIQPSLDDIQYDTERTLGHFTAYFKIGEAIISMPVSINLLSLMLRILEGYMPNKHDKTTVVMLDEVTIHIAEVASKAQSLHVLDNGKKIKISNIEDEDFEVSGL
ncbi:DNA phosphorothioation-dependent restriction protein DptF [Vibrio hangzhouensis]|uniref:DNA phosphorothioation-dependent restriction protein DptF n=1 Tax=Vibrio hangzhouensis TaxID=462991 RepID=UPI001C9849D6|nr:DNA phosphorothioation-dependent restriction protein DptF [Vibrio hangzhouensis]MBY6197370.1 DNA phosphorothioation-dependent restriction protein DptF [Vibrio hangzhouensis]